jgi:hypothetical protein
VKQLTEMRQRRITMTKLMRISGTARGGWLARLVATGLLTASLGGSVALGAVTTAQGALLITHIAPATMHLVASTISPSIVGGPGMP